MKGLPALWFAKSLANRPRETARAGLLKAPALCEWRDIMATSSILRPIERIEDEETMKKIVKAMEDSENRAAYLPASKTTATAVRGEQLRDFFKAV
jgi:hypothetical protein